ncbi:hypothetical protein [Mycoplasma elephantis]|uniref:hypothetical protein n=1 Tax=Mycoplasma elephantis TaxID=114882 RepID=UPI000566AF1F|nr:hypothetical protein [Mycoplasma elephantis]
MNNKRSWRTYKHKKVPLKTGLKWLFIGKNSLERLSAPKILEYVLIIFTQVIIIMMEVLILYIFGKYNWNFQTDNLKNILEEINGYTFRIMLSASLLSYLFLIILCIHVYCILPKTEFYKWAGILSTIFALTLISPLAIIFCVIAYEKNEIVFQ